MTNAGYESKNIDHLGIVSGICKEIKLIEQIDELFQSKRKVSVGTAVQAMIINALGFTDRTLYMSPQFFENKPIDRLVGKGIEAKDLNDDSLGRALDSLYEKGITEIFAKISSESLRCYGIDHKDYNLDSTSMGLHGEYDVESEEGTVKITNGYSRDDRGDLKQVVISLICTHKSSLPIWLEVHDGNKVDKSLFPEIIENYIEQMNHSEGNYWIADSALYSAKNIEKLSTHGNWITRVPQTLSKAKQLIFQTDLSQMKEDSTGQYRFFDTISSHGNVEQRWIVVHSEKGYQRHEKTMQKKIAKCAVKAEKKLWHLSNKTFETQAQAQSAFDKLQESWTFHNAVISFEEVHKFSRRGRPKPDDVPSKILYKINGEICLDERKLKHARKSHGKFILATNELCEEKLPTSQILMLYKGQSVSVERGFRFLKDPMFFASSLYLKKPQRIMALVMVMTLSLLIYSLAERKLRLVMAERNETIPNQLGKEIINPTIRWVFQIFQGIHLLIVKELSQNIVLNVKPIHQRIASFLGTEVENCYSADF